MPRIVRAVLFAALALSASAPAYSVDSDLDGVDDPVDNCVEVPNDQLDSDLDGYGNVCDGDFDNDGSVGGDDFYELMSRVGCERGDACWDELAERIDLSGEGAIGWSDYRLWITQFERAAPARSGLACASRPPCTPPPPLPGLPVVQVRSTGVRQALGQADIEAALEACWPGCNLLFLAGVYDGVAFKIDDFPDGFAMFGYRDGDDEDETLLRSPLFEDTGRAWQPLVALGSAAPDGVVVQDLTLDGRKHEQRPPLNSAGELMRYPAHLLTGFWGRDNGDRADGIIRRIEVRDFIGAGISIGNAPRWRIEDTVVAGIGCNQLSEPCGDRSSQPGSWDELDEQGPPGNKVSGIGIVVLNGSDDALVARNQLERGTKFGIEVYGDPCIDASSGAESTVATRRVHVVDNTVWYSRTGITVNGGCDHLIERNRVYRSFAAAVPSTSVYGAGFECGYGAGTTWRGNWALWNQGSGFALSCPYAGGLVFEDNRSIGNCLHSSGLGHRSDLSVLGGDAGDGIEQSDGLWISNFISRSSQCYAPIVLSRRSGVTITDSQIDGGWMYGVKLSEVNDVVVERTTITSTHAPGDGDIGILLDSYQDNPANNPSDGMRDVYLRASTRIVGFDSPVVFEAPLEHADGDDVSWCVEDGASLAGCREAP